MENKTVLITGAGIGIGKATALLFAQNGFQVIVTDVLEEEGQATVEEINNKGGKAVFYKMDVSSTENVKDVFADIRNQYQTLSTLVNNAGIAHRQPSSHCRMNNGI